MQPYYGDESPIAACATALSPSAIAVIRISGKSCIELLEKVFSRPSALGSAAGHTIVYGWIIRNDKKIDEVLVSVYRAPKSYTGEDSADINCHGGLAVIRAIMQTLVEAGFREALRGEFSFRAFQHGKIDLSRAESIMELVAAKSERARESAVERLSGVLYKEIQSIEQSLIESLAELELHLDYSEIDGIEDESSGIFPGEKNIRTALQKLKDLLARYAPEKLYTEGATAVFAGAPNAGKSSLFNYLLNEERSIVSASPGTTRDWIEAWIRIEDIPLRIIDTAGIRDEESADEVEKCGIVRSKNILHEADIILYVIDGTEYSKQIVIDNAENKDCKIFGETFKDDRKKIIYLWNKADAALGNAPDNFISVSAKNGDGIPELIAVIAKTLRNIFNLNEVELGLATAAPGNIRQKQAIEECKNHIEDAFSAFYAGEALEIPAMELREAVHALSALTGSFTTEKMLETMFSRFCLGK